MAPNELLKPLGVKTPKPPRRTPWHLIAAGAVAVLAIVGLFVVVLSDHPLSGGTTVVSLPPQAGAPSQPSRPSAPSSPAAVATPPAGSTPVIGGVGPASPRSGGGDASGPARP